MKKRGKKKKDQGSVANSPNKKIKKRSKKDKKKSKLDVASASVEEPPSTTVLVPVVTPGVVATTFIVAHDNEAKQVNEEEKEKENLELTPGFIFMCNGTTKPECYINRVFGLPKGQVELVKKIKPGAKLFLYDFDLKLLYGVYEATSNGELGFEPTAFNGRFPAQVRFKIFKECLPLTEKAFKHTIKDNYHGSKFRQDLTSEQVKTLISLFRPISAPASVTAAPSLSNVVTRHTYPVPVIEERFQLSGRLPPAYDSYLPSVRYGNALPTCVSQSEQVITRFPYDQQQSETYVGHGHPCLDPRHIIQQAWEAYMGRGQTFSGPQHIIQQALETYVGHGQLSLDPRHIIQQALGKYVGHGQPPLDPRHVVQQALETYVGHGQPPLNPQHMVQQASGTYVRPVQPPKDPQLIVQQAVLPHCIESYYSMGAHQLYLPEKSSLSAQDMYGSYMPAQETVQMDWVTGYVSEQHSSGLARNSQNLPLALASQAALQMHAQRDSLSAYQHHYPVTSNENLHQVYAVSSKLGTNREVVQRSVNMVDYCCQNLPPASASHVLLQTHEPRGSLSSYQPHCPMLTGQPLHQAFANLPPASASHFSPHIHAQSDFLSSYQAHYPVTTNNDLHRLYTDPLQRPVYGSSSLVEASVTLSSYHSTN